MINDKDKNKLEAEIKLIQERKEIEADLERIYCQITDWNQKRVAQYGDLAVKSWNDEMDNVSKVFKSKFNSVGRWKEEPEELMMTTLMKINGQMEWFENNKDAWNGIDSKTEINELLKNWAIKWKGIEREARSKGFQRVRLIIKRYVDEDWHEEGLSLSWQWEHHESGDRNWIDTNEHLDWMQGVYKGVFLKSWIQELKKDGGEIEFNLKDGSSMDQWVRYLDGEARCIWESWVLEEKLQGFKNKNKIQKGWINKIKIQQEWGFNEGVLSIKNVQKGKWKWRLSRKSEESPQELRKRKALEEWVEKELEGWVDLKLQNLDFFKSLEGVWDDARIKKLMMKEELSNEGIGEIRRL